MPAQHLQHGALPSGCCFTDERQTVSQSRMLYVPATCLLQVLARTPLMRARRTHGAVSCNASCDCSGVRRCFVGLFQTDSAQDCLSEKCKPCRKRSMTKPEPLQLLPHAEHLRRARGAGQRCHGAAGVAACGRQAATHGECAGPRHRDGDAAAVYQQRQHRRRREHTVLKHLLTKKTLRSYDIEMSVRGAWQRDENAANIGSIIVDVRALR